MILPIYLYGEQVLRQKAKPISFPHQGLDELLKDMFETMYQANGVGLAAPQIGKSLRIFVVDASPLATDEDFKDISDELKNFKKVFINPQKIEEKGELWKFTEGCLSIPNIREDVSRKVTITLTYQDELGNSHTETFSDIRARIIQHEYDHLEGVLFTDHLSPLKKRLLQKKLNQISKGMVDADYKIKFPK